MKFDKIIEDIGNAWQEAIPTGIINKNNPYHVVILEGVLDKFNLTREQKLRMLNSVRGVKALNEDWWSDYTPEQQAQYIKDHPKSEKAQQAKEKQDTEDEKDTEKSKIGDEQVKKEKARNESISKVLDLFTKSNSETKGSGRFKLDENDVKIYTEHLNLTPEERVAKQQEILDAQKEKIGEISDADIDMALDMLKEKLGTKGYASLVASIKKKGDPPGEFTTGEAGKQRLRNVIKHYLQTGGVSAITGEVVPFSDSQLDHVISLDNWNNPDKPGDGPHNWEWMEARFNQFKGSRTEPEVRAKLIERGMRTESEWLLELNEDELNQYQNEQFVAYWQTKFEKGDIANLSSEEVENMTNDEIDYLTKAWNLYVGDENDPKFIPRYGDRQATLNGKRMSYSRGGVVKPDKKDPDTWGWAINKNGEWEKDKSKSYEDSLKDFKSSRASGGQKITREEIQMKLIGGKDEVTGQEYEGVLKTGDGYPSIPDGDQEQDMDESMQEILEYKLNKKAIIDKFKDDRKKNPKSSFETGKRVKKATDKWLKDQNMKSKWSKKEKKENPEEYKKWEQKKNDFVLDAWKKELESK